MFSTVLDSLNDGETYGGSGYSEKLKIMKANTAWIINWLVHLKNLNL